MKLSSYCSVPSLSKGFGRHSGRNAQGKITVRHRGGGHKQAIRQLDWMRKSGKGFVRGFEYDPQRNANLAKLYHSTDSFSKNTSVYSYIIAPAGLKLFQELEVFSYENKKSNSTFSVDGSKLKLFQPGDCAPIGFFETGDFVHNVAAFVGKAPSFARASGSFCQIRSHYQKLSSQITTNNLFSNLLWTKIRLPSGNQRYVPMTANVTFGMVAQTERSIANLRKAGRSRWLGKRPSVRGVAMNPVDHPHGGGQGKTSGGRPSVTFKSWPTKGQPTRNPKRNNRHIVYVRNLFFLLMSRSTWKPKFIHSQLMLMSSTSSANFLQNRATVLTSSRIGQVFHIYNGNTWFKLEVTPERLGHRVGEFAPTRKRPVLKKKKPTKKKNLL